jgi:hypothetical protein
LLTIWSAEGRPASALLTGSRAPRAHDRATGTLAISVSFMASTIWSRTTLSGIPGKAIRARMTMIATTTISSSSEKPAPRPRAAGRVGWVEGRKGKRMGDVARLGLGEPAFWRRRRRSRGGACAPVPAVRTCA